MYSKCSITDSRSWVLAVWVMVVWERGLPDNPFLRDGFEQTVVAEAFAVPQSPGATWLPTMELLGEMHPGRSGARSGRYR